MALILGPDRLKHRYSPKKYYTGILKNKINGEVFDERSSTLQTIVC